MIKKYRKKPVVIEAIQFTGDNWREVADWINNINPEQYTTLHFAKNGRITGIIIKTPEGEMLTSIGDYVIKGINGEFYPCKPDIFEKTYECIEK